MDLLQSNFNYYLQNQAQFVEQYVGKFLLIKDRSLNSTFETASDALRYARNNNYEMGTFIIQECLPGEEAYTQVFRHRVSFSPPGI